MVSQFIDLNLFFLWLVPTPFPSRKPLLNCITVFLSFFYKLFSFFHSFIWFFTHIMSTLSYRVPDFLVRMFSIFRKKKEILQIRETAREKVRIEWKNVLKKAWKELMTFEYINMLPRYGTRISSSFETSIRRVHLNICFETRSFSEHGYSCKRL